MKEVGISDYLSQLLMTMRNVLSRWTDGHADTLKTMMRYPLGWVDKDGNPYDQPTGKRIRPLLLLITADAAGGNWHQALPAAAAIEFLHNFSLIHDDIQDDSLTRHGRPTVWQVWEKPQAINIGDGLFALSYAALSELAETGVEPSIIQKVWNIYNRTNLELIRGQYLDMTFEKQEKVTVEQYLSMITGKSAALIAACAQIGALIGSGSVERASAFAGFGLNLGIAFQIRDDILGIWGDPAVTGKSAATDILTRKKSLPLLYGISHDNKLSELYKQEMTSNRVSQIVKRLDKIGASDYAKRLEGEYYSRAMSALEQANPEHAGGQILANLAHDLLGRNH